MCVEEDKDDDDWSLVLALVVVIVALGILAVCLIVVICETRSSEVARCSVHHNPETSFVAVGVRKEVRRTCEEI